jgi:hypothetical protein
MLDGDDAPHDQLVADIVQCGHGDCKALRIDSLDGWPTAPKHKLLILLGLQGWLAALDDFRNWLTWACGPRNAMKISASE